MSSNDIQSVQVGNRLISAGEGTAHGSLGRFRNGLADLYYRRNEGLTGSP